MWREVEVAPAIKSGARASLHPFDPKFWDRVGRPGTGDMAPEPARFVRKFTNWLGLRDLISTLQKGGAEEQEYASTLETEHKKELLLLTRILSDPATPSLVSDALLGRDTNAATKAVQGRGWSIKSFVRMLRSPPATGIDAETKKRLLKAQTHSLALITLLESSSFVLRFDDSYRAATVVDFSHVGFVAMRPLKLNVGAATTWCDIVDAVLRYRIQNGTSLEEEPIQFTLEIEPNMGGRALAGGA